MVDERQIVISASRRTDIPAFYLDWFMDRITRGYFEVPNPYNQKVSVVPATTDRVHTIVFWSKDFGPFLKQDIGDKLLRRGFNLFFNFTLNSEVPLLEPRVPPLAERLRQLEALSRRFDPRVIHWRFDPICFFRSENGERQHNLVHLDRISEVAARAGIQRCITSFVDLYAKVRKRVARLPGMRFEEPHNGRKIASLLHMEELLRAKDITLSLCCEKELFESLPPGSRIGQSSCIPNDVLAAVYGGKLSLRKDSGQRVRQGCGCRVSSDIGSYRDHPCYHNCLFCYANPS
ncbi:MAG: hypothetical protein AMJ54_16460 [Deltaproteobacteria bacterium SG8_13]|nr:MAG: hypothetical protein AMJ54_16460 [Deltaproteobacteria bacterium SG8_13]